MKKYLLSLFAVVLAIAFSAFTSPTINNHNAMNEVYWFSVESGAGNDASFTNSTATFVSYSETAPNLGCTGSGNKCVIKFDPSDLNIITPGVDAELDDNNGASPKTPLLGGRERGTP